MIKCDLATNLESEKGTYIQILIGPRQCGKSTLVSSVSKSAFQEITLDDLQIRNVANQDPALLLSQYSAPLIVDEVLYAPNIFPEIKRIVDNLKKQRLQDSDKQAIQVLFRLTGSNQILLGANVKETLSGRASYYDLNTLSVHEI